MLIEGDIKFGYKTVRRKQSFHKVLPVHDTMPLLQLWFSCVLSKTVKRRWVEGVPGLRAVVIALRQEGWPSGSRYKWTFLESRLPSSELSAHRQHFSVLATCLKYIFYLGVSEDHETSQVSATSEGGHFQHPDH